MPNRTEARPAKAALTNATGRLPILRLFSTPLIGVQPCRSLPNSCLFAVLYVRGVVLPFLPCLAVCGQGRAVCSAFVVSSGRGDQSTSWQSSGSQPRRGLAVLLLFIFKTPSTLPRPRSSSLRR